MLNIEFECAAASDVIKTGCLSLDAGNRKEAETLITKALGVLQENGIYAFYLYMKSKEKKVYEIIESESKKILKTIIFNDLDTTKEGCQIASEITDDLDKMLLAKDILERVLVYSRYHAKTIRG